MQSGIYVQENCKFRPKNVYFAQQELPNRQRGVCSFLNDQKGTKESPRGKHMRFRRISALSHVMFPPWNPVTKDAGMCV